ncbi:TPA_asm: GDP-L-fucose synthase [Campylobacter jejuni]|uniref:GDP-L-fucose synthase n=1 Tax=Campylobacter jejuni subsp. jejuni TaxID=32022 RepID=A0A0S2CFV4_CAMJU|nr:MULTISPECIES: GDP-L-fucose synthase [Campylobacter]ALN43991.1 GDP-L-fucose synthetase [Campylobacter jejuni subsp. jejuni]EDO6870531.1 GDP-L-fucose synthase [Campylobacter coli]AXL29321.1 GDP-4-keto-6-deoxy-D-mannose-3, 5-epimerase-4-reductase [Campylobacter jejuni]EAI1813089.1 GDP-L-fucose synthase [Campylobacter jejuni]EAK4950118.1 GDP-L-fucose synthase [Campylobacter jejuni]
MNKDSRIYIAGHKGTAGTALVENLKKRGYENLILKTRQELNLLNQQSVIEFFKNEQPEYVFLAAVLPCGAANVSQRADFIYENTTIQNNIIHQSFKFGVKKLIFFGSGYMYPEKTLNPIKEESMLTDILEYNATSFGVAKISGALMCESYNIQYGTNFITLALNNLYGTRANFDFEKSRVLPALLRKFHLAKLLEEEREGEILKDLKMKSFVEAKKYLANFGISKDCVEIWGTGKVRREFIHSDDLADAAIYVMENVNFSDLYNKDEKIKNTHINIGTGIDYSIAEVTQMVKQNVGFKGKLIFNPNRPDSTMDRLMDCSKIHSLGWRHKIELEDGIKMMYDWYLNKGE